MNGRFTGPQQKNPKREGPHITIVHPSLLSKIVIWRSCVWDAVTDFCWKEMTFSSLRPLRCECTIYVPLKKGYILYFPAFSRFRLFLEHLSWPFSKPPCHPEFTRCFFCVFYMELVTFTPWTSAWTLRESASDASGPTVREPKLGLGRWTGFEGMKSGHEGTMFIINHVIQAVTFLVTSWRSPTTTKRVTYFHHPQKGHQQNCQEPTFSCNFLGFIHFFGFGWR